MLEIKTAQEAIDDFVEAIAKHYLSTREQDESGSVAEEFVSAIETDLKSTLRDRLSMLDTVREVEETPTVEFSPASLVGSNDSNTNSDLYVDALDQTLDTAINLDAISKLKEPPGSGEMQTMDTSAGVIPSTTASKPQIRSGNVSPQSDFSHDDNPTLDTSQAGNVSISSGKNAVPDGYEILGTLGKGGMGVVYKAKHVPLNRLVAVKMIISGEHASEEQLRRFQIEAEAAAHLSHPNIVSVYEVGEHNGLPYFSLEFVDGQSMSELMGETTMNERDAAAMLIPVARAIDYSHKKGVLHRDLKPQNILITPDGVPKVADFGLAKRLDNENDGDKTREGVILGTPGYMAPEQAHSSNDLGPHTDVYALGCILYYVMTGRPPFVGPTPFETVRQVMFEEPLPPSKLQVNLDADLETICMKALEKDITRRYATADEFADELQRFLDGKPIIARPVTRRERLWKWCKRNPRVATLSGIAASLLLCLLFGGIISAVVINEQKKSEQLQEQMPKRARK